MGAGIAEPQSAAETAVDSGAAAVPMKATPSLHHGLDTKLSTLLPAHERKKCGTSPVSMPGSSYTVPRTQKTQIVTACLTSPAACPKEESGYPEKTEASHVCRLQSPSNPVS